MKESFQSTDTLHPAATGRLTGPDGARVLVLGLNAWLVLLALPTLLAEPRSVAHLLWLLLPLPALVAGVIALERSRTVGAWVLLGGYPTLVVAIVAAMPQLVLQSAYSTVGLVLGASSMVAFGAGAAYATMRPPSLRPTSRRPLGSVTPVDEPRSRRRGRHLLVGAGVLGSVLIAIVAPALGGVEAYGEPWGRAAPEAAVLTAVVGGALGAVTLAIFVGPTLRAPRGRKPSRRQINRRVAALLVSVVIGVAFYVFYVVESG